MSYISIEASIGVGKSTILPSLAEELKMVPVEEDLSKEGAFLASLKKYNENRSSAIELQTTINNYRNALAKDKLFGQHLFERSMMSDIVFAKVMMDRGEISRGDYKLFKSLAEVRLALNPPEIAVFLSCDPKVAFKRMKDRGRPEESSNKLDYMIQLEEAHEDMLVDISNKIGVPLIRIDYTDFVSAESVANSIRILQEIMHAK